jgi:hypothetical protein
VKSLFFDVRAVKPEVLSIQDGDKTKFLPLSSHSLNYLKEGDIVTVHFRGMFLFSPQALIFVQVCMNCMKNYPAISSILFKTELVMQVRPFVLFLSYINKEI